MVKKWRRTRLGRTGRQIWPKKGRATGCRQSLQCSVRKLFRSGSVGFACSEFVASKARTRSRLSILNRWHGEPSEVWMATLANTSRMDSCGMFGRGTSTTVLHTYRATSFTPWRWNRPWPRKASGASWATIASQFSSFFLEKRVDGELQLKRDHICFMQVQGEMAVLSVSWCGFAAVNTAGGEPFVKRIFFDGDLWYDHLSSSSSAALLCPSSCTGNYWSTNSILKIG